jgi:hypothetical protein
MLAQPDQRKLPLIECGGRSFSSEIGRSFYFSRKEMLRHNLTNGNSPLHRIWWPIVLLLCTQGDAAARPDQRKLPASSNEVADASLLPLMKGVCSGTHLTNGSFLLHRMWWPIVLLLCTKGDYCGTTRPTEASCFIECGGRSFYFSARKEMLRHNLANGSFLLLRRMWWPIVLLRTKGDATGTT